MHETGCSGLVHWDNPDGWGGDDMGLHNLGKETSGGKLQHGFTSAAYSQRENTTEADLVPSHTLWRNSKIKQ